MTFVDTEPVSGRYGCPHCEERFESVGDKKRHVRTQHPEIPRHGGKR